MILSTVLIGFGCSDTSKDEEPEVDSMEDVIEEEADLEDVKEDEESSNTNLFDTTRSMDAYYYEVTADLADGTSYVTKIWSSENKTKMESHYTETGENIIMIMDDDDDLMYIYMPAENMAMKMKLNDDFAFTEEDDQQGSQDYIEIMKEFADDETVDVENGTLDGESVKIVTGEIDGNINKIWISNKTGFPLKSEFYMDGVLESSATFTNFDDKSIDPSIFDLPEGVEVQDMTNF